METVYLILADGTHFSGKPFGSPAPYAHELPASSSPGAAGEVVFNTSMTGYHEILTDPSYAGQIILMTYPHIGNYGTSQEWNESGPEAGDRKEIKACGLIVRDYYDGPVPPGRISLHQFMVSNGISGITGIDTRRLTLSLRDHGSRNGVLVRTAGSTLAKEEKSRVLEWLGAQPEMTGSNLLSSVGTDREQCIASDKKTGNGDPENQKQLHLVLLDCGIKGNIIREITGRGARVTLLPSTAGGEAIEALKADGLLVSNGPGDPAVLYRQIALIRECMKKMPVFGICLGHQLISLALGAKTYKMKFGHHGGNHPVRDERTGKVFVTAQNHGFAVDGNSLPDDVDIWFTNTNDNSIEGILHTKLPVMAVQFHPEAAPGPHDAGWIFDAFLDRLRP